MTTNPVDPEGLILFLDIDGVLHPEGVGEDLHFVHLANFEAVLREFPLVHVVVSSAWRLDMSLDDLRQRFSADIRARIVGVTPSLPHLEDQFGQRQRECELWLRETYPAKAGPPRWLALDDRESYFDRGCPNLVLLPYVHFGGTGLEGSAIRLLRQRIWQALQPDVGFNETP